MVLCVCVCVCVCIAFESFDDMLLRQCISRSRERLTFYIISPPRALDTSGIPRKTVETKARPHAPNSKGMHRTNQPGQGRRRVVVLGTRLAVRHRQSRSRETGVEHPTTSIHDDRTERELRGRSDVG